MKEQKYREKELEQYSSVGITKETWGILTKEKKKQKKSRMRIIDDLVKEKYGKV